MPQGTCKNKDCTVAETGKCLELHAVTTACPNFVSSAEQAQPASTAKSAPPPKIVRQFHSGLELGTADSASLMRGSYNRMIAILGAPNVGKTALLASLYLLASHGKLRPRFKFYRSQTLQGFDTRSKRLRNWQGGALPKKLTEHTILTNPRSPGFLHLGLQELGLSPRLVEFLLTDLPGEWTNDLIDRADAASRFPFLQRADAVFVAFDGPALSASVTRYVEAQRARLLFQRLANEIKLSPNVPLVMLVTKGDILEMKQPRVCDGILDHARGFGFRPKLIISCAFSKDAKSVASGMGLLEALEYVLSPDNRDELPESVRDRAGRRAFHRFGLYEKGSSL